MAVFFRDRAIGDDAAAKILSALPVVIIPSINGAIALSSQSWEHIRATVGDKLDAFHPANPDLPGIPLEQLRRAVTPILPAPIFIAALRKLVESGDAALDRSWVRRPSHQVKFSAEEERLFASIIRCLRAEPYRPPRVRDIAKAMTIDETNVRRVLRMASRRGETEEIAHDHFFTRGAVEAMARIAIALAEQSPEGKFTAAEFRDRLDNGRKVAIQVLEFFDRHGFTIRRQDLRRINPARVEFFISREADAPCRAQSNGGVPLPVERLDFKSRCDRQTVSGGFDSHPPPPPSVKEASR